MAKNKWLLILGSILLIMTFMALPLLSGCSSSPAPASPAQPAASATAPSTPTATQVSKEQWGGVKFIRLADGSSGDPAMEQWTLVCSYWSKIPGIQANPFAASSGTQIFAISEGTAEAGTIYGSQIMRYKDAKNLPQGKTKPVTNVSSLWTVSCLSGAILVRADSKIQSIEELKSATIGGNLGETGFGGTSLALLEAAGITTKNIGQTGGKLSTMTAGAAADGLRDKTLDAWIYGGTPGAPSEAATTLDQEIGLRILHPSKELVAKASQLHPEFVVTELNWDGTLKSEKGKYSTPGDIMIIGIASSLPDDLVYQMVKQVAETDCFDRIHKLGPSHKVEWTDNMRIGTEVWGEHPGAKKYYDEKKIPVNKSFLVK